MEFEHEEVQKVQSCTQPGKMPDAKTIGRWGRALGPEVIKQIRDRIVGIAHEKGIAQGGKMRVDTTVVETNIHHPT
jgi:IS5 family transposase